MNVTVTRAALVTALKTLKKVVPSKPAYEILGHALVATNEQGLVCYATNLEQGIVLTCPAEVTVPGQMTLPVERLLAMAEQCESEISLTLGTQIVVKSGNFVSRLRVLPVSDFPQMPKPEGEVMIIDAGGLSLMIDRIRHAVTASGSRFVLKGALLTCAAQTAVLVATDGQRLALATLPCGQPLAEDVVVPEGAFDLLTEGMAGKNMLIRVSENRLFFKTDDRLVIAQRLMGVFPQYQRIIPQGNDKVVTVSRTLLMQALKRVLLASDTGAVAFAVIDGHVELHATSTKVGDANERVSVTYAGEPVQLVVRGPALLDFLKAADKDTVVISMKDANTPILIANGSELGSDHLGVISTMRL